jgi:hypothetical protein
MMNASRQRRYVKAVDVAEFDEIEKIDDPERCARRPLPTKWSDDG